MKRSMVVKFITQKYQESFCGGDFNMSDEERMDFILKQLEELGMLPPELLEKSFRPLSSRDTISTINKWEDEES